MDNTTGQRYAGFWVRFCATVIDVALILAVTLPLLTAVYGLDYFQTGALRSSPAGGATFEPGPLVRGPMDFLISYVLPAVAVIVFWRYKSATPGKMIFSARIVDARTGAKLSLGQCVGRYFAYLVSTVPLCLGFLWIAFDKRKQGWHDKLAGTVVVR